MSKLYYTIGLPRSGKSTICTEWAKKAPMRAIVCSDNIRLALTGKRYEPLAETMVFATKHIMIRSLLDRGFDVVVDGTHSTEISIQRILEIDINAIHVIVDTPPEVCKQRAIDSGHSDLADGIIDRIYNNLKQIKCCSDTEQITVGRIILPGHYLFDFFPEIGPVWQNLPYYPSFEHYVLEPLKDKIKQRNLYGNF